jgi:hypothetical protein
MWNSQYNNYPEVYVEDPAFANPYTIPVQQNNYEQPVPQPMFTNGPAFSPGIEHFFNL